MKSKISELIHRLSKVTPFPETELDNILKTEFGISLIKLRTLEDAEIVPDLERIVEERVLTGIPFQYLTGRALFMDEIFFVSPAVLIPRAETELLVETASDLITRHSLKSLVDVGTGSGIIAITLKKRYPALRTLATDISFDALKVAKKNAILHSVDVDFVQCNLLSCLDGPFDLIVSNPPYVGTNDPYRDFRQSEPEIALIGGEKGYELSLELIFQAADRLSKRGYIIIEVNPYVVEEMMGKLSGFEIQLIKDFNGANRVMVLWMT